MNTTHIETQEKQYNTPYCRSGLDVINNLLFNTIKPTNPEIHVHPDCPQSILEYVEQRLNQTVPKLSII